MKANKSNHNQGIEHDLKSIYQDSHGNIPDMTSLDYKKSSPWKLLISIGLIILGLITAAAWSGFLWYSSKPSFTGERISLNVSAPFTVISGDKTVYNISITNNEDIVLRNNYLLVRLPVGFILKSSSVEAIKEETQFTIKDANNYRITLPEIDPHSVTDLNLTGQMISAKDIKPTITVKFKYTPDQYSSEFEKNESFSSDVIDSAAAITVSNPSQVLDGEKFNVEVNVKNIGQTFPLEKLRLMLNLPESFKLEKVTKGEDGTELSEEELKTLEDDNYVAIDNLEPQTETKINLIGSFTVEGNSNEVMDITLFQGDSKDGFIEQVKDQAEFQIIKGDVLSTLIINGADNEGIVNFDSELSFLLTVKNKSASALGEVEVRLVIDSPLLDWKTLIDKSEGTRSSNQILWTSKEINELKLLLPEDEVTIPLTVRTKPFTQLTDIKPELLKLQSFAETTVKTVDGLSATNVSDSNTVLMQVSSDLTLKARGRYFDEDGHAVGSGPLPPKVGDTTTYQVELEISNSLHELKNIIAASKLPSHVTWVGEVEAESGELNLIGDEVVWKISRLPTSVKTVKAKFKISVTPKNNDANKILTLFNETILKAFDAVTESEINSTTQPFTTKLDPSSSGLVQD